MSKFYIPPGINYPSHTDPATNGRGPEVVIYPIHIRKANGYTIGVDSLMDVEDQAQSGDLVIVFPGTYDIGDNSIQLKDGVNWKFEPGVTVSSDSVNGTVTDNNVEVNCHFRGQPKLINTSSNKYRLRKLNVNSNIKDFYFEFSGSIAIEPTDVFCATPIINTFGEITGGEIITSNNYMLNFSNGIVNDFFYSIYLTVETQVIEDGELVFPLIILDIGSVPQRIRILFRSTDGSKYTVSDSTEVRTHIKMIFGKELHF